MKPTRAVQYCQQAYQHTDLEAGEAKALVSYDHLGTWVAFQGTHDIGQALEDLDCRPRFIQGIGYCHHGFSVLAEQIYPLVKTLASQGEQEFILTGHSLGGAIAILVAAMLVRDGVTKPEIITFGAPRVSVGPAVGRVFARTGLALALALYRNGADVVPDLPPILAHPVPLIQIGSPSDGPEAAERDHAVARYIAALQEEVAA